MSLRNLGLAAAASMALSTVANAKDRPEPAEATTAEMMAQCKVEDRSEVTRRLVVNNVDKFNEGLQEALEAPSKRELAQALARALFVSLGKEVDADEITKRMEAIDVTLDDRLSEQSSIQPNRELIQTERQETLQEEALLDLVITVKGKPYKMKTLLAAHPQFESVYRAMKAMAFAEAFQAETQLDCKDAIAYAAKNGDFPAVRASVPAFVAPEMEIKVPFIEVAALEEVPGSSPARMGFGLENEEFGAGMDEVTSLETRFGEGMTRFARRYDLGNYQGPKVDIKLTLEPEKKEEKSEDAQK